MASITIGQISAAVRGNPCTRFINPDLRWNPISRLAVSKCKKDEISFWGNKTRLQYENRHTRNSFVVYANTVPGAPLPSGPPPSHPMSWILGLVVSFVLPFFTNKWGPLWVLKNRIENAVQTVENIAEAVEHVAEQVEKVVEDIADDLPQGKLRDLVELVEHVAEKTAKTADCLDNVIDKVQEAEDQVEEVVECVVNEAKKAPKKEVEVDLLAPTKEVEVDFLAPRKEVKVD